MGVVAVSAASVSSNFLSWVVVRPFCRALPPSVVALSPTRPSTSAASSPDTSLNCLAEVTVLPRSGSGSSSAEETVAASIELFTSTTAFAN